MNYTIIDISEDMANKFRVRVDYDENDTLYLKFDHYPTQIEIEDFLNRYFESFDNTDLNY